MLGQVWPTWIVSAKGIGAKGRYGKPTRTVLITTKEFQKWKIRNGIAQQLDGF